MYSILFFFVLPSSPPGQCTLPHSASAGTIHGPDGISKLVDDRETGLLEEADAAPAPKKGIKSFRALALKSVMSKWYASCILLHLEREKSLKTGRTCIQKSVMSKWYAACVILRLEKEKEPEKCEDLHVGGLDGISCQHLQVLATNLLQTLGMSRR